MTTSCDGALWKSATFATARLDAVLQRHRPVAIVHFAAQSEIGRSIADPLGTYAINVGGTVSLLAAAERAGIDKLVFSSTCAVYGRPQAPILSEDHVRDPINPYGRSKAMIEEIIEDQGRLKGLRAVVLRYFNAAGADPECHPARDRSRPWAAQRLHDLRRRLRHPGRHGDP